MLHMVDLSKNTTAMPSSGRCWLCAVPLRPISIQQPPVLPTSEVRLAEGACVVCAASLPHLSTGVAWYAAQAGQVRVAVGAQEHVQGDLPAAGLPGIALEEGILRVAQLRLPLCGVAKCVCSRE